MGSYRLGVDIGGTFTDLVLADDTSGEVAVLKILSTPENYARGVLEGMKQLLAQSGRTPAEAREVVHGTTVATNTLLQRRGARTGLLTTRGFRDVLEMRRMRVPRLYDLTWEKPPPIVPRALRLEVDERLDAAGQVVRPLGEASAVEAIRQLMAQGVEAIAVCLLHSYANPAHEARLGELLRTMAPGVYTSLSTEVLPQIQEYERTSTTAINAYIGPAVGRYLEAMQEGLAALGVRAPLLVMQSNGGGMSAAAAQRLPAALVESGPAAGAIAAAALGRLADEPRVLALDMGGTTAKAAFLQRGVVPLTSEAEIGAGVTVANRLNRGGGYLLSLPSVDLVEVGAGGGSMLWIDAGGVLCVGPQSAGAVPGPACYGAGGTLPTLTDANVALGYLSPRWLLGGALALDAAAARRAIEEHVAGPLGLSVEAAAFGAHRVAVASMVRAVRAVSAERGHDPRRSALVAFGGNGPLHAAAVAEALGIPRILVPPGPGVFSAYGLLAAEVEHHFLRTSLCDLTQLSPGAYERLNELIAGMRRTAYETLAAEGYPTERVALRWAADVRYLGQSFELTVPLTLNQVPSSRFKVQSGDGRSAHRASGAGDGGLDEAAVAALAEEFGTAHERTYGHRATAEPVELVNVRLVARGIGETPRTLPAAPEETAPLTAASATRRVYFAGGWCETPVLGRGDLTARPLDGPLVVEEYDATTLVPPNWSARLAIAGAIVLETSGSTAEARARTETGTER